MKQLLKSFAQTYTITSISMGLLGWLTNLLPAIQGRVLLAEIVFGSIMIALLIQFALWIYQQKWGNGIISVLLAFVVIISLVIYTILIAFNHAKNKKDSDDLNHLIKRSKKKKD
jgi:hypothetical protein